MALLDDVLAWSESGAVPMWQRDALRRLFLSDVLSDDDLNQVYRLLKIENGVAPEAELNPEPLAARHMPGGVAGASVQILSLSGLSNINAFPDGRSISFAPEGLTAVYGANGAGKSGYARVLKQACRARYRENVRPNAFAADHAQRVPSADVGLSVNGVERTYRWNPTSERDADLASVAVFDAACSEDYISNEGETAFQPYGLSKIERLASEVIPALLTRLNRDVAAVPTDDTPFRGLIGDGSTAVGRLVQGLSKDTNPEEVVRLGNVSDAEAERGTEIERALAEQDPEPRALAFDRLAARLDAIRPVAASVKGFTTDRALIRLRELIQAQVETETARENAERALRGEELLPGTGGSAWKLLFSAAQAYSTQEAYQGHAFPHDEDGSRCVLCQMQLTETGKARFRTFSDYVTSNATTMAQAAREASAEALGKIQHANLTLGIDETLLTEIGDYDRAFCATILEVREIWQNRQRWMLGAAESKLWDAPPPAYDGPDLDVVIGNKSEALRASARTLRQAVDRAHRVELEVELKALRARQALAPFLPAVQRFIQNSGSLARLERCRLHLQTRPISLKAGTLAQAYISDALVTVMKEELHALGFRRNVTHQVERRAEVGRTLLRVSLHGSFMPAKNVLSEAEQRASALAFFFAEFRQAGSRSALIFDDPVSSLDHVHRRKVADRIVAEAKVRQVVVLTHDSVFLTLLQQSAKRAECPVELRALEWDSQGPGALASNLPWDQMQVGARLNELDAARADLERTWGEYPAEEVKAKMAEAYGMLRGTIERLIRDDILNKVVTPYSERVAVEDLGAVIGFAAADWESLLPIYDRACGSLRGHDTTTEGQLELPDPAQLGADLEALKAIRANAVERKREADKARKARKV